MQMRNYGFATKNTTNMLPGSQSLYLNAEGDLVACSVI